MDSAYQASTIALSATTNTASLNITEINDLGVQIVVTTSANTGVFTCQCSNDDLVWSDMTFDTPIAALAGANVNIFVNVTDLAFRFFRVKFTIGVGTNGSAVITIFGKEL